MKKLILIVFLVIGMITNAQYKFQREKFNIGFGIEPTSSYKEQSPNITIDLEYQSKAIYIRPGVQFLPALEGGYIDLTSAIGVNFSLDRWENTRVYFGGKIGAIKRQGAPAYGTYGGEIGVSLKVVQDLHLGGRFYYAWREDFLYSGANPAWQPNGMITLSYTFKTL